jgi:hypothetical protein
MLLADQVSGGAGVVLGAAIALTAAVATTWLSEWHTSYRAERQRQDEKDERRNAFRRDTLLALQDAMFGVARSAARLHTADLRALREHGTAWGTAIHGDDISDALADAHREAMSLMERVDDAEIRTLVASLTAASTALSGAASKAESQDAFARMGDVYEVAMARVGVVLRESF